MVKWLNSFIRRERQNFFLIMKKNMCQIKRKMTGWDTVFATYSEDFKLAQYIKN